MSRVTVQRFIHSDHQTAYRMGGVVVDVMSLLESTARNLPREPNPGAMQSVMLTARHALETVVEHLNNQCWNWERECPQCQAEEAKGIREYLADPTANPRHPNYAPQLHMGKK